MTRIDPYFSIMTRQRRRFEYAEKLGPKFAKAAADLGAQRTESALADWLNKKKIKTSSDAAADKKWHRQRLPDILTMRVDPPALDSPQVSGDDLKWAFEDWDTLSDSKRLSFGPRYAVTVWFVRCRRHFEYFGDLVREEEKLRQHLAYIESVISKLQAAFPLATRIIF